MYRPHKTPPDQLARARLNWRAKMAAMTPDEQAAHKAKAAAYAREWRAKTAGTPEGEARRARQRESYRQPEKMARIKATARNSRLLKTYGISEARYQEMVAEQDGKCHLCGSVPGRRGKLAIDHCHRTGRVRRLLCDGCNTAIAGFERLAEKCGIERALAYVKDARRDG
jgi:hypothetical protein